ncbi:hypothetical protein C0Q44_28620 [Paenibacillus sp. PCH8]|uniref:hypothetical protein n=1 Tax=Paenibacillus sp. PCH8 TaxID=2066524 RepID=UPI000CF97692|nr:hypothetical protein [Paenibacillus sp. PCH8]PQP80377.1 hypothetical protein C0Q44_28620 [Paenibacillus sp. PCH8]
MESNNKRKIKIGWKRSLIFTLALALILGVPLSNMESKAQAATFDKINKITSHSLYWNSWDNASAFMLTMDSGKTYGVQRYQNVAESPVGARNVQMQNGYTPPGAKTLVSYINESDDFYVDTVLVETGVKDYVRGYRTIFILKKDGSVTALGNGSSGELGIGYKQSKSIPTEVVDPDTGEPITGIEKIFFLGGLIPVQTIQIMKVCFWYQKIKCIL